MRKLQTTSTTFILTESEAKLAIAKGLGIRDSEYQIAFEIHHRDRELHQVVVRLKDRTENETINFSDFTDVIT